MPVIPSAFTTCNEGGSAERQHMGPTTRDGEAVTAQAGTGPARLFSTLCVNSSGCFSLGLARPKPSRPLRWAESNPGRCCDQPGGPHRVECQGRCTTVDRCFTGTESMRCNVPGLPCYLRIARTAQHSLAARALDSRPSRACNDSLPRGLSSCASLPETAFGRRVSALVDAAQECSRIGYLVCHRRHLVAIGP
jgi:hypothetical protein